CGRQGAQNTPFKPMDVW
nr:immunoglobulin heavy chain junction region [Macaca mulatta]MOW32420.1 immunoglobulin heavy chain junction region [Macaca mulatta]MOW32597.1 immunoglobulin heavy chain junction region [Macaca mulatta]MOW32661.1 immunoglobulin heavy chain junction region [Macaca mulatta]MOW32741.1 immunoglobulin heavy chain junction region [Macaca mulatta]